jgi:hypothetical protein
MNARASHYVNKTKYILDGLECPLGARSNAAEAAVSASPPPSNRIRVQVLG